MELNSNSTIKLTNVENNETFTYSVIIVKGCIHRNPFCNAEDQICVNYLDKDGNITKSSVINASNGKFSTLLYLKLGENDFSFKHGTTEAKITFLYLLPSVKFVVSPMFIICDGENLSYQCLEIIKDKIGVVCCLIQTVIAEILYEYGFGRRTFFLEPEDTNGNGGCLIHNSKLDINTASTMSPEKLWEYFGREIMTSEHGFQHRKFLSFLSCGRGIISQNLAIGGGGLALCSAEYLRTWPCSIDKIIDYLTTEADDSFTQINNVNPSLRSRLGASLGAVCHELCHVFDLGHSNNGIMGRDFNRVGMIFSLEKCDVLQQAVKKSKDFNSNRCEADSLIVHEGNFHRKFNINYSVNNDISSRVSIANSLPKTCNFIIKDKSLDEKIELCDIFPSVSLLNFGCATLLAHHKWIHQCCLDRTNINIRNCILDDFALYYDAVRSIVTSKFGIVVVQLRNPAGYVLKSWEFLGKKRKTLFLVPICESRKADCIIIEDLEGNLLKKDIEHFEPIF